MTAFARNDNDRSKIKCFLPLLLCFVLSACGFHSIYSQPPVDSPGAVVNLSQVHIDTIADRQGQKLRNDLIDIMQPHGEANDTPYQLVITYTENEVNLGLSNNAEATRGQLTLSVTYQIKDIRKGNIVTTGNDQAITGFNIQTSEFATILSRDDAEDRALRQVASEIALRVDLFFKDLAAKGPETKPDASLMAVPNAPLAIPGAAPVLNPGYLSNPDTLSTVTPGQVVTPVPGH